MKIVYRKSFIKDFEKLQKNQKKSVNKILKIFESDPYDERLRNHELKGKMKGYRSINSGGDLRLIFEEYDDYIVVVFLAVGSHAHLYG